MSSSSPLLKVYKDGAVVFEKKIDSASVLGRGEDCFIRLNDKAISRKHAILTPVKDGLQIEKQSEFAPLKVNDQECTSQMVKIGDIIHIGPYLAKIEHDGEKVEQKIETVTTSAPLPATLDELNLNQSVDLLDASAVAPETGSFNLDASQVLSESNSDDPPNEGISLEFNENNLETKDPSSEVLLEVGSAGGINFVAEGGNGFESNDGATKVFSNSSLEAVLSLHSGAAAQNEYAVNDGEMILGRASSCHVVLTDKKISKEHAKIIRNGVDFKIVDLGSPNGVFVNGKKVNDFSLNDNDVIQLGDTEIRFNVKNNDFAELAVAESVPTQSMQIGLDGSLQDQVNAATFNQEPTDRFANQNMGFQSSVDSGASALPQASSGDLLQSMQSPVGQNPDLGVIGSLLGKNQNLNKKKTLLERFKEQPKPRQLLIVLAGVLLIWFLLDDTSMLETKQIKKVEKTEVTAPSQKLTPAFKNLSPDQKAFVETQYQLGFGFYTNREYDKALFEIRKIFQLIPDFKDARDIERYAEEGKRKLKIQEEERIKKEEAEKSKAKVIRLVEQTQQLMIDKKYKEAKLLFPEILEMDPENPNVSVWQDEIKQFEIEQNIKKDQERLKRETISAAKEKIKAGDRLKDKDSFYEAIEQYQLAIKIAPENKSITNLANRGISTVRKLIKEKTLPFMEKGLEAESRQDYQEAYQNFKMATEIDPRGKEGYAGIDRVRGALHEKAKFIYTEGILAESYSDFKTAKAKFQESLKIAPEDDIYYERSFLKMKRYKNLIDSEEESEGISSEEY